MIKITQTLFPQQQTKPIANTIVMTKAITVLITLFIFTSIHTAQTNIKPNAMILYKHKMTPQSENFVDSATLCMTEKIIINASIEKVWSIIDDTPNFNKWFPGLILAEMIDPAEKGLGAKRKAETKQFKYYEEIIAYEELSKWGFTMIESNSKAFESITEVIYLRAIDQNQTEVTYKGGYEPKGFLKWMKGIVSKNVIKAWKNGLESLKAYAEQL